MSRISPVRITGLSGSFDMEGVIEASMMKDQENVDKAKQAQQLVKWRQEIYRDVIKDTKDLYDKYFSSTSPNSIRSKNAYTSMSIKSSDESIIKASGSAGANKINYQFAVSQMAEPPKISIKMNPTLPILTQFPPNPNGSSTLTIKGKSISIDSKDNVQSIVTKINGAFTDNDVKATYSEMTGELVISLKQTGSSSKLPISIGSKDEEGHLVGGNDKLADALGLVDDGSGIRTKEVEGKNLKYTVKDSYGNLIPVNNGSEIPTYDRESGENLFTIDNITYDVGSIGTADLKSVTDTEQSTKNMKAFVDDYNKLLNKVYDLVTKKKSPDFPPLTDKQKEEMTTEEIEKWEKKSKEGILRNDNELRAFVDDVQKAFFGSSTSISILSKMGISEHEDYNKRGQISFDEKKFSQAIVDDSDLVYNTLAKYSSKDEEKGVYERLNGILYDYAGSSGSKFAKKSGIEKTASANDNIYSKDIAEKESNINRLIEKMNNKEDKLYSKYSALESLLNKFNSQMSYFDQSI